MWARIRNFFRVGRAPALELAVPPSLMVQAKTAVTEPSAPEPPAPQPSRQPAPAPEPHRPFRAPPTYRLPLSVRMAAAATTLFETNVDAAARYGLGSETSWDIDQNAGILQLTFADGTQLACPAQIIGSLHLPDQIFKWAWQDSSVPPHMASLAEQIRNLGEERGDELLTTARQILSYDEIVQLVAFAGQESEAPVVYRVALDQRVTVFLALMLKRIPPRFELPGPSECAAVESAAMAAAGTDDTDLDRLRFVVRQPGNRMLHVRIDDSGKPIALQVAIADGRAVVVGELSDWGSGFLWPNA
jgi:hypothetical protein